VTFSADDLDESNARQIEKHARVEWAWQLDDFTPHREESEAAARAEVADAKRFFPQENYRVLSRTVTDWIES
jgi:hypothetical protein